MAVQPDKRPKQVQDESAGTNITERYRHGPYWLGALSMLPNPVTYTIRRDGAALHQGDVWLDHTRRWTTTRGGVDHWDDGPLECLQWWVNAE
jgi:hypothetical protein